MDQQSLPWEEETFVDPPPPPPRAANNRARDGFHLRNYQFDAVAKIRESLSRVNSTLVVMPTGCGKTEVFVDVAQYWPGRVLIIAPLLELVGQAARKLQQRTGVTPAIEQAELESNESGVCRPQFIVGSKQTLCGATQRFRKFKDLSLVIVDEAHLAATTAQKRMIDFFLSQGAKVLGVTATPRRHDKVGLKTLFDECCFNFSMSAAMSEGWLAPPMATLITLESLDLSDVRSDSNDFILRSLAKSLESERVVFEIAEVTAREYQGEKTVVFCASVKEARAVAERLADKHGVRADWVCGDKMLCPAIKRQSVLDGFTKHDRLDVLCNVGVLVCGWDFPGLKHIVVARPTKSRPLYQQIIGRATRPLPGVVDGLATKEDRLAAIAASEKPHFRVTDLRDNSTRHKLVSCVDVLRGTDIPDVVVDLARECVARGEPDVQEALAQALRQHRQQVDAEAEYRKTQVNLFTKGQAVRSDPPRRQTKMPFGKHKGLALSEIDTGYLKWLHGLDKGGWLGRAVFAELKLRGLHPLRHGRIAPSASPVSASALRKPAVEEARRPAVKPTDAAQATGDQSEANRVERTDSAAEAAASLAWQRNGELPF